MEKIIKPALERNQWYVDFCWDESLKIIDLVDLVASAFYVRHSHHHRTAFRQQECIDI